MRLPVEGSANKEIVYPLWALRKQKVLANRLDWFRNESPGILARQPCKGYLRFIICTRPLPIYFPVAETPGCPHRVLREDAWGYMLTASMCSMFLFFL